MLLNQLHVTFFLASLLLGLSPGPDNLFVLLHSAQHGTRSGLLVVLGLCTGLLFHTAAVALGLAALLTGSVWGLLLLKSWAQCICCGWPGRPGVRPQQRQTPVACRP
jgi:threonine/homoserine/homoserine lactone efflux protein